MSTDTLLLLASCFALAALLYSSVGHGGASGYLGIMALFAVPAATMRPTALALNVLVAGLGAFRYVRSGAFDWKVFWPFAVTATPAAFLAGQVHLPPETYRPLLGAVLAFAGARYLLAPLLGAPKEIKAPALWLALLAGAALGVLAGLTGTGGGIFLSPLLVAFGWAGARETAGISACFIVVNSLSGLAGQYASLQALPPELPWLALAAVAGGVAGTTLNLKLFSVATLLRTLGIVLLVASAKLLFT